MTASTIRPTPAFVALNMWTVLPVGPQLLQRSRTIRQDVPIAVALAYREFESWFLASAPSLRGVASLPDDLATPLNLATIRDAKGWLGQRMINGYYPIIHQRVFTKAFDLQLAKSDRSFLHFFTALEAILNLAN